MSLKKDILWRVALIYIGTVFFALLIIGRVLYIQIWQGGKYSELAQNLTIKDVTIEPNRGDIYDEENKLLASSVPYFELRMDMKSEAFTDDIFYNNVDSLALCLSQLFKDKSKDAYKKLLVRARRQGKRYYLIKKGVDYLQLKECKTFPIMRLGKYKGGFIYTQRNSRVNPHEELASRTIGYLNRQVSGTEVGLEGAFDHYLRGIEGMRLMQRVSGGVLMPLNDGNEIEPQDGMDLVSTINVNIQDLAHTLLYRQLVKHNAHHGCVVVMEVKTGEVKAIVNLKRNEAGQYREVRNYAIGNSSEPGSTFKLISLMAALEDRYISMDDSVFTYNGQIKYYGKKMSDSEHRGHGWVNVQEAFELSSNVAVSQFINNSYKDKETSFVDRLYSMNLNEKLGIPILGEGAPKISYPGDDNWSKLSLPWMSIGYEVRMTPLQILTFYNAVANDGKMIKPIFAKELRYHGKLEKKFKTEVINSSICSSSTIKKAQAMLEGVVERGTAKSMRDLPFKVAGKTGTAKLLDEERKGYQNVYEASFVGYFPADNPMYSCIVVINRPSNGFYYGAEVAGPVFKEIAKKVYASKFNDYNKILASEEAHVPYTKSGNKDELEKALKILDIKTTSDQGNSEWVVTKKEDTDVALSTFRINQKLVPDVTQMGAKDALYILENLGLKVRIVGRGTVVGQSIPPGRSVRKGDEIILTMSFT